MTIPRLNKIYQYQKENAPPAFRSLAASIGFKPTASSKKKTTVPAPEEQKAALDQFFAMFPERKGAASGRQR